MPTIFHDTDNERFSVSPGETGAQADSAVLEYRLSSDGVIDFHHTFVPPEFRGTGVAEALVRKGIVWAREQGYQVEASCWYANKFIK